MITADFNGDGKLDLAIADSGDNAVAILLGNGDGTFRSFKEYSAGLGAAGSAAADFNGDGKLDLAVFDMGTGAVTILLGNGDGTFQKGPVVRDDLPGPVLSRRRATSTAMASLT